MALLPVAVGLMAAGMAVQGVSAIQGGNAQAKAARVQGIEQQQEADIAAENTKITAQQQQSQRLDDLHRTLGTISATVASRNLDPSSPSGMALAGAADTYARRDVSRIGFNSMQTAANYRLGGQTAVANAAASGSIAKAAGYAAGFGSFLKAGSLAAGAFGSSGGGALSYDSSNVAVFGGG